MSWQQLLVLVGTWALYFGIHSVLASLRVKRWVAGDHPQWMRGYRLFFNLVAMLLVLPPLWLTWAFRAAPLWQWSGGWWWLVNGLALAAVAGFLWSLRYYDGSEFLGLRQWREGSRSVEDQECFQISPLHRYVRHPWYSLGLTLIWTRGMDPALLVTALAVTLYFLVGSRLEERKLLTYHGDVYARYRERVPSLLPLPWRFLDRAEARRLLEEDRERSQRRP